MKNKQIDENYMEYINKTEENAIDFKNKLEELDIQDEELEKARGYFINSMEFVLNGCKSLKEGMIEWNLSKLTITQTDIQNANNFMKKGLDILNENMDIDIKYYSWSI